MSRTQGKDHPSKLTHHSNANNMKKGNEYVELLGSFEKTPKAVYAAIAVSFANRFGVSLEETNAAINEEWESLFQAGIVPQKPVK